MRNTLTVLAFVFTLVFALDAFASIPQGTGTGGGASVDPAYKSKALIASEADQLLCDVAMLISGSLGTLIGILVSVWGLYTYLIKKTFYGFFFFIAGVALTGLPGIFVWFLSGLSEAFVGSSHGGSYNISQGCAGTTSGAIAPGAAVKNHDHHAEEGRGLSTLLDDGNLNTGDSAGKSSTCRGILADDSGAPLSKKFCVK